MLDVRGCPDLTRHPDFGVELGQESGVAIDRLRQELQSDLLPELQVIGAEDFAHPAFAEPADDPIADAEDGARREASVVDAAGTRQPAVRRGRTRPPGGGRRQPGFVGAIAVRRRCQDPCHGALKVRLSNGSGHSSRSLWYTAGALQMPVSTVEIPNRSLFRQPEVCEIAQVQPYVLRSWEAEFPDLGVTKTAGGPRVYRRADLERVLRLKHLLFVEGLTLAGARRKLESEQVPVIDEGAAHLDALIGTDVRERIMELKRSLRELHAMLSGSHERGERAEAFALKEPRRMEKKVKKAPARKSGKRAS